MAETEREPGPAGWEQEADRYAARSLAAGDPTGWFERLYDAGRRGEVEMPWDRSGVHPLLQRWTDSRDAGGAGRRAVVVGCGLGADADHVARLGYRTVAFDISGSAVRTARDRRPESTVEFVRADLLDLPEPWVGAFDLAVEIYTVQALPAQLRARATAAVTTLVAPGGTLVVIASARDGAASAAGPPWPLDRTEVEGFAAGRLDAASIDVIEQDSGHRLWLAEFRRPAAH